MSYESKCYKATCSARVCLTADEHRFHRERGTTFYCAAGHPQVFRKSEVEKLREEVERLKRVADRWRREAEYQSDRRKCPFAGCLMEYGRAADLARHLVREHGASKRPRRQLRALPEDAGPDAHGSGVPLGGSEA